MVNEINLVVILLIIYAATGGTAVRRYGDTAIRRYGDTAVRRYGGTGTYIRRKICNRLQ